MSAALSSRTAVPCALGPHGASEAHNRKPRNNKDPLRCTQNAALAAVAGRTRWISAVLLALGMAAPSPALAIPVFGTGVGFDSNFFSGFTGVTESVANNQIVMGRREVDVSADNVFGSARAQAKTTQTEFSLGARADSIGPFFNRRAWAFASTGFTTTGVGTGRLGLIFTIDGDLFAGTFPSASGSALFSIFAAGDGSGGPIASVIATLNEQGQRFVNINDANGPRVFAVGSHIVQSLRVHLPPGTPSFTALMLANSHGAPVDFLGTATLTAAELPAGATLALDTGQVFTAAVATVPEPRALFLFGAGLALLALFGRRRMPGT